jgi:hypothetical protein
MHRIIFRRVLNQAYMDGVTCKEFNCKKLWELPTIMCSHAKTTSNFPLRCFLWKNTIVELLLMKGVNYG